MSAVRIGDDSEELSAFISGVFFVVASRQVANRDHLTRSQIIYAASEFGCVVCLGLVNSMEHLFNLCEVASLMWYEVLGWLCFPLPLLRSILRVCEVFQGFGLGKNQCLVYCRFCIQWYG